MHIFIPEIIYQRIKADDKFISIYQKFNNLANSKLDCIVKYNNHVDDLNNYEEFFNYMSTYLTDKERKIWHCFCVDIDYDEKDDLTKWLKSKSVIDHAKKDDDIDIKMYGYYQELANTADHESDVWIDNINQSIEIWEKYEDRIFDPRLYTKYYWDKHEKFSWDLKFKKGKDILESYYEYNNLDTNLKKFLFSKNDSKYFTDIINHKTLYTIILFWGSINDISLDDTDKTLKVIELIDQKIISLNYKYSGFNMHLIEWVWIVFKWWFDQDKIEIYVLVWDYLINLIKEALKNKPYLIKALTHHNYNYTSRFLTFVSNLYEIEQTVFRLSHSRILDMNWSDSEKLIITGNPEDIKNIWIDRKRTADNYQKYMIQPIKNKLILFNTTLDFANK